MRENACWKFNHFPCAALAGTKIQAVLSVEFPRGSNTSCVSRFWEVARGLKYVDTLSWGASSKL